MIFSTERQERALKDMINKPSVQVQRVELKKKLYDLSQKRVKIIKEYLVRRLARFGVPGIELYQDLVRAVVNEQRECARIGLEALQISANRNALKTECARKDEKYERALLEFQKGGCNVKLKMLTDAGHVFS